MGKNPSHAICGGKNGSAKFGMKKEFLRRAVNVTQAVGCCCLDGFSSGCWSIASQATKKATTSRSLSDPTSRPQYQGAKMTEKWSHEEPLASGAPSLDWSARSRVWASRETSFFSNSIKVKIGFHVPIRACLVGTCNTFVKIYGRCRRLFDFGSFQFQRLDFFSSEKHFFKSRVLKWMNSYFLLLYLKTHLTQSFALLGRVWIESHNLVHEYTCLALLQGRFWWLA